MKPSKNKEKARLLQEEVPDEGNEDENVAKGYQLRVHIIEARELKGRDASGQSDPVVVVSALGKKGETAVHKSTTSCMWDHLFIWEFPKMRKDEFLSGVVTVEVFDANTIARNEIIGTYELDVGTVYETEGHEIWRSWAALADPTDKFEGIQGYLQLSVVALGPGEAPAAHAEGEDEEDSGSSTDLQKMILLPPKIQTEELLMSVRIYRGEDFPVLDKFGFCDPFVKVNFAGIELKTEIQKGTLTPVWNEALAVPVSLPILADKVKLTFYDWDAVGKNELISIAYVKFSEVRQGKWNSPRWINLYGSPYPQETRANVAMNSGFTEPSGYRGRVLIACDTIPMKEAKKGKQSISAIADPPMANWGAFLDLYEGTQLDVEDGAVEVELKFGSQTSMSKKIKPGKEARSLWYENLQPVQGSFPSDTTQVPDIFINVYRHALLSERKRIGYLRVKAADAVAKSKDPPSWNLLKRDIIVGGKPFSGFLLSKLVVGNVNEITSIARASMQQPASKKYQLRANIYQGRALAAADDNGLSDPYCVVHLGGQVKKTKVHKETTYPIWYETLTIDVSLPDPIHLAPHVNVLVYDRDQFSADDLLGVFNVPVADIISQAKITPTWYALYDREENFGKKGLGEILASFQLLLYEQADTTPILPITPQTKDSVVNIGVVGMRQLLPYALQPIQNSFIEFRCGNAPISRSKPCKKPNGANPTILENIEMQVKLPVDPIFCPAVDVKVYDNRIIYKPLIGATTIQIDKYLPWLEKIDASLEKIPDPEETILDMEIPPSPQTAAPLVPEPSSAAASSSSSSSATLRAGGATGDISMHEIIVESPRDGPTGAVSATSPGLLGDIRIPLLGKKRADTELEIPLPSLIGRTLREAEAKIPLGLEGLDKEMENEKGETVRSRVDKELERFFRSNYHTWTLHRGKKLGLGPFKKETTYAQSGLLKGQLQITDVANFVASDAAPSLGELYQPKPYVVRAYILRGLSVMPKDRNGLSDCYIVINASGPKGIRELHKDNKNIQKETLNPLFFKCYEAEVTLPGDSELVIEMWDWDAVGGDELIGRTSIDLENRQFSENWRALEKKPIELRSLKHPCSSNSQGQIEMWLDIMTPQEAASTPQVPIGLPAPRNFELRLIIWNTKDVAFRDKNMSDIFLVAYIEGMEPQKTDIHWRSENGEGMFNWRMIFPVTLPYKNARLKLQIWDKDLLNPNDVIAEASLNLNGFFRKAYKDERSPSHSIDRQFITLTHPNYEGPQGRAEVSIELLTETEARRIPAGKGRGEPNANPFLPPPDRPETSFNPLNPASWISKVLWKKHKGKFICCCICLVIVILIPCILFLMNIAGGFL